MMKRNNEIKNDEIGSIGIGAMIVFIALILVAAVASAVIIQTGEKLQQNAQQTGSDTQQEICLLYTSPSPRDRTRSRMPSSA